MYIIMKRLLVVLVAVVVLATLVTGGGILLAAEESQTDAGATVVVWPAVAKLHSNTPLVIMGSGFDPGQEVYVLLQHANGSTSNIVDGLDPMPVADEGGNFGTLFVFGRLERISAEGVFSLTVTDVNYNTLAIVPIGIADPTGRSRVGIYPRGEPDYAETPDDPRPLPWCAPFFEYPERPE